MRHLRLGCSLLLLAAFACTANAADAVRERAATDEIIYFVLPDRFENGNPANDRGGPSAKGAATG